MLHVFFLFAIFTTFSSCIVTFSSPTKADSWIVGQTKSISWSQVSSIDNPKDNYLSVRLYQVFQNTTTSPFFSYLIQQAVPNTINVNPAGWPVALDKSGGINSSLSNKYILALYFETQTKLLAQSEVFTIQNTTAATSPSSTTKSSTASSSFLTSTTSTSISSALSLTNPSMTPSFAATSASSTALPVVVSNGLSTGLKASIAIGVSAAVVAGLAAGWFLSGWRKWQGEDKGASFSVEFKGSYEGVCVTFETI